MRAQIVLCAAGLSLALSAAGVSAAGVALSGATAQAAPDRDLGHAIRDLGLAAAAANSDDPTAARSFAPSASSADATPVPELPTWGMMLLFFVGLGFAAFKKGRKDRLSPGI
jgi:hypothetical protein